ncbi:hypothetical protein HRbin02_01191 [Candidatus Calditenuaceae archaeon HR02]|nr:hypothetical protein HRbin02_01191 [Candidatus Calditenuaceae archaeon HR02]
MYVFSIPLGREADGFGRVPVTATGVVVGCLGSCIIAVSKSLDMVTWGIFLVSVGWSAATVGSIALSSGETYAAEKGKSWVSTTQPQPSHHSQPR